MNVQPLFQNTRLVDANGFPTVEFKTIIDQMQQRSGGISGGSLGSLDSATPTVVWDLDKFPRAVLLVTGNRTIAPPVNMVAGDFRQPFTLRLAYDAVGGHAVSFASNYRNVPAIPNGANQVSELCFTCDGANMVLVAGALNF